jgi:hypothetical protein
MAATLAILGLGALGLYALTAKKGTGGKKFSNGMPADANLPPENWTAVEAALTTEPASSAPGDVAVLVAGLVSMASGLQQNYPLAAAAIYQRILALQARYSPA